MSKKSVSDVYQRYHKTPGDTSEGRVQTILFSLFGCVLCVVSLLLYKNFPAKIALLTVASVVDLLYAYVEISHFYIRKYWFRYHRRLAVVLSLLIYWAVTFVVTICVNHFVLSLPFTWHLVWIPFFFMPPLLVILLAAYCLLHIIGN